MQKMGSLRFIVLAVLFVGFTQINGWLNNIFDLIETLNWKSNLDIYDLLNHFRWLGNEETTLSPRPPPQTLVRKDIKGRLLSPEEGCGYSKVSNTRIVGGAPSKVGNNNWS